MRITTAARLVVLLCCAAATAGAQQRLPTRDSLLVSTSWLAAHYRDPDVVLLHIGDPAAYAKSHIPGAKFVPASEMSVSDHSDHGLMLEMPSAQSLRDSLAALGISDNSTIVVYFAKDWVTPSTRVVFTLDYAGLGARTRLLDGGMDAWIHDGHEVTDAVTPAHTGRLSALKIEPIVVTADYVRAHLGKPSVSVVDGRASSFYDGVQTPNGQRTGHIAGAKSVPFTEITDDALHLKSADALAALFTRAGVAPGDTVIGYCHIGQQATGMLFAARLTGHPVLLYDGSFQDWSRHADFPVDNPSANHGGKP